jgi:hypothetical protein
VTEERLGSFEEINYLLRPSKQVERKLFVEVLHRLALAGYELPSYTYLGMGSIYFADFLLFHKYLYIDRMICAEDGDIPKRMKFNRPFQGVQLHLEPISDIVPRLKRNTKYLVWLDYDYELDGTVIDDVAAFIGALAPGSILIVTVNAHSRWTEEDRYNDAVTAKKTIVERTTAEIGKYYRGEITTASISKKKLPILYANVLRQLIIQETQRRPNFAFIELFNFRYADGHQMVTLGGILDEPSAEGRVTDAGVFDLDFVTPGVDPLEISVPPLTGRERAWLDRNSNMKNSKNAVFEIRQTHLNNYRKFARHYPVFLETLL